MKLSRFLIIVLAGAIYACSPSNSDSPNPDEVFVKYFGTSGLHQAIDIVYNSSRSEYFILGTQDLGTGQFQDFFYVIADEGGNLIDQRAIAFQDSTDDDLIDIPESVKQINDDEYYW